MRYMLMLIALLAGCCTQTGVDNQPDMLRYCGNAGQKCCGFEDQAVIPDGGGVPYCDDGLRCNSLHDGAPATCQ